MTEAPVSDQLLHLTAQIVSAHVSHNAVTADALPGLIREVYRSLSGSDEKVDERRRARNQR